MHQNQLDHPEDDDADEEDDEEETAGSFRRPASGKKPDIPAQQSRR
jgi:hypothetical protein